MSFLTPPGSTPQVSHYECFHVCFQVPYPHTITAHVNKVLAQKVELPRTFGGGARSCKNNLPGGARCDGNTRTGERTARPHAMLRVLRARFIRESAEDGSEEGSAEESEEGSEEQSKEEGEEESA